MLVFKVQKSPGPCLLTKWVFGMFQTFKLKKKVFIYTLKVVVREITILNCPKKSRFTTVENLENFCSIERVQSTVVK